MRPTELQAALLLTPEDLWRGSYYWNEIDPEHADDLRTMAVALIDILDLPTADAAHDDCRTWQYRPMTRPSRHPLDWNREDA